MHAGRWGRQFFFICRRFTLEGYETFLNSRTLQSLQSKHEHTGMQDGSKLNASMGAALPVT